jgi:hypothetical protein
MAALDTQALLLPAPRSIKSSPGRLAAADNMPAKITGCKRDQTALLAPLKNAGIRVQASLETKGPCALIIGRPEISDLTRTGRSLARLQETIGDPAIKEQACVIEVLENAALLMAGGEPGLFYAVLTLAGLVSEGSLPCVSIQDRPALRSRAVLLDISRGRVPTLSALKELTDLIATLKYNQLTFNIEHAMACPSRPEIGAGRGALSPAELKELDDYAFERCVEVVPFQQSLGHLRGIVSLPEHRGLAYDPDLLWSLDPAKPGTYELLADLYDTQISVTRSSLFHAGCDEPFDIMKKFDPSRFSGRSLGAVVRDHLIRLHGMLKDRGRTMMAWADAVVAHPEIIPDLPRDLALCHWLYGSGNLEGPEHYRPGLETIASSGLPFYACTCSWSLMKIFPDLAVMRANHNAFIPLSKQMGAQGMMLTIWGDMGHMNLTGLETYPLAYGARHAWEDAPDPGADVGPAYAWTVFRDQSGAAAELALTLDRVNEVLKGPAGMAGIGFLLLFAEPLDKNILATNVPPLGFANFGSELISLADKAKSILATMENESCSRRSLWLDHYLPVKQLEILGRKIRLIGMLDNSQEAVASAAKECDEISSSVAECFQILESRWLVENREADLEINRSRYRKLIAAWRARAEQFISWAEKIKRGEKAPSLDRIILTQPSGYSFNPLQEMGLIGLL